MLSGRGICDELITRPEESYRLCCVVVCDLETSRMGAPYIYDISHLRFNVILPKKQEAQGRHKINVCGRHLNCLQKVNEDPHPTGKFCKSGER